MPGVLDARCAAPCCDARCAAPCRDAKRAIGWCEDKRCEMRPGVLAWCEDKRCEMRPGGFVFPVWCVIPTGYQGQQVLLGRDWMMRGRTMISRAMSLTQERLDGARAKGVKCTQEDSSVWCTDRYPGCLAECGAEATRVATCRQCMTAQKASASQQE
eukprot:scaffold102012_cov16-Tisochrysis_lutea.AAC.1